MQTGGEDGRFGYTDVYGEQWLRIHLAEKAGTLIAVERFGAPIPA
jgi:hypothetical protein